MRARGTYVKVCGVCSREDAAAVCAVPGVDVVGVVLAPGPRHLDVEQAREVLDVVPPHVSRAGVFVDPTESEVAHAIDMLGLRIVQLHGSESPEFCGRVFAPVVKAFRVGWGFDPACIEEYRGLVAAVLLDSYAPGAPGGTGTSFPWHRTLHVDDPPMMIAGGLTPANVGEAMRTMRPTGVDVSSGVESSVRCKDPALVRSFVAAVRAADAEMGAS